MDTLVLDRLQVASIEQVAVFTEALVNRLRYFAKGDPDNVNLEEAIRLVTDAAIDIRGFIAQQQTPYEPHAAHCACDSCEAMRSDIRHDRRVDAALMRGNS